MIPGYVHMQCDMNTAGPAAPRLPKCNMLLSIITHYCCHSMVLMGKHKHHFLCISKNKCCVSLSALRLICVNPLHSARLLAAGCEVSVMEAQACSVRNLL